MTDKDMEVRLPVLNGRLTGLDASFLYLERKEIPLHMAVVLVFDGPISFDYFIRIVDSKLHMVPRFRQIVVVPPLNLGYPTWEGDANFDIRRHIFRLRVDPPGEQAELEALSGRILSPLMDRSKPLWDMYVVEGLKAGRGALIVRLHHAMADGIGGAGLLFRTVLDTTSKGSRLIEKRRVRMPRQPDRRPSLTAAVASGIRGSLANFIDAATGVRRVGQALLADRTAVAGAAKLVPEILGAVERLPFNRRCRGDRKFCWAEFGLGDVNAIRKAGGGTVNDVILTVLTRAIARYIESHGQTVANRLIRVACPVNLRQDQDNGESLGNRVSILPVVLALDIKGPIRNLQTVAARTAAMKKVRSADMVAVAASCLGITPPAVQAMLWRSISNVILPLPLFHMICTNVPGPQEPLYCAGRKLLACYPQVPTGYDLGINCAVTSYSGRLFFGLIADADVAPDVTRLRDFLHPCFEELLLAAKSTATMRSAGPDRKRKQRTPHNRHISAFE